MKLITVKERNQKVKIPSDFKLNVKALPGCVSVGTAKAKVTTGNTYFIYIL